MRKSRRTYFAPIAMARSRLIRMEVRSTSTASPGVTHMSQNRHEDTKDTKTTMAPLRISSPLPDELERLVDRTCHRRLHRRARRAWAGTAGSHVFESYCRRIDRVRDFF